MRTTGHDAPFEFLPDVVGAGIRVELDYVGGFRLHLAGYVAGRNNEGVVAAGAGPHGLLTTGYRGPEQRTPIVIRTMYFTHRDGGSRRNPFERRRFHRASGEKNWPTQVEGDP